jgi:AcrR family transcriptional regulator
MATTASTQPMAGTDRPTTVRDDIVAVALARLGDADFEALLKAITPEVLAADAPWAASTVRYHFRSRRRGPGAGTLSFQRRDLGLAMLESSLAHGAQATAAVAETYEEAAEELPARGSFRGLMAAIRANLDQFIPGAAPDDISPRERMYHLAVAVADTDSDAARLLRSSRQEQLQRFEQVYAAYLTALDRELRPGRTLQDLADAISAVLDGHLARVRFDPGISGDWVGDAVLAILAAFTTRRGAPAWDVEGELLP